MTDNANALEELRVLCAKALPPQDWLDSEEFFDAIYQ